MIAASAIGCDVAKKGDQPAFGAPPVLIGTSFEKFRQPDGSIRGVKRVPLFVLRFSRPMAPSSASRANFILESGSFKGIAFVDPRVDPVERAVIFTLDLRFGPPLEKNTQYQLTIHSAGGANALAAYDGAELEGTTTIVFTTANDDDVTPPDLGPAPNACEVYSILTNNCAATYCHGGGTESSVGKTQPAMGLNLYFPAKSLDPSKSFADPIAATAVDQPALEVQDPSAPGGPTSRQPRDFPKGMAIVLPKQSASSYLMYKILLAPPSLGSNPAGAYLDPTVPDLPEAGQAMADDLATRMFGQPMPNPQRDPELGAAKFHALGWLERAKIRAWIDGGALPCACKDFDNNYVCPPSSNPDAGVDSGSDSGGDSSGDTGGASDAGEGG